ncbi:MAG: TIGR02680 family protein, partial [Nitriliruptoraceae bacterium]
MTVATRFRPTRAGVIGLWDYGDAAFAFADGRLVLRGANGSGKTKALEVLFPFVLDGRLDPRRLDPFSGENRTMKANLLWRGGDVGHGYAWLEFAQPTGPDQAMRFVTVGVGLQAQRHRPSPRSWFFVADGRVGEDLVLVDPDGRPRTKKALAAALGDGVVLERASEHRRRVDEVLFGLGPERYEAMLDLVLTLRRPMLAKDLDPRSLSETLSRGLRPLDEDLIEQVARSFDDLEAVQRDLDRLIAADEATTAFVTDYRGYLRTQARHRADVAIDALADR